jgi:hypothetical protein
MVENDAVNLWDLLGLSDQTIDDLLEEKEIEGPCYELEIEGEVIIEPWGQTAATRTVRNAAKKVIGKKFKSLKKFLDAGEMGAYEAADLITSLNFGYQLSLLMEFECDCDGWFTGSEEWEEDAIWDARNFSGYNKSNAVSGDGFGSENGWFSADEAATKIVAEIRIKIDAAKKTCLELCSDED